MSYGVREYTEYPKSWKPWFTRFVWYRNLHPWIGGDEWCRWTLVVPLIYTSMVIPLWACRDPNCEACLKYCDLLEVTDDSAHG